MSNVPEGNDSEFTWESFQQTVNKDLSDVLGNFVSRTTKFCNAKWGAVVPEGGKYRQAEVSMWVDLTNHYSTYETHMNNMEFRKAIKEVRELWVLGNEYLQECQPWTLYKTNPNEAAMSIRFALNLIVFYANLSAPFIPDTARKIHEAMGTQASGIKRDYIGFIEDTTFTTLPAGHKLPDIEKLFEKIPAGHSFEMLKENLFEKITNDQVAELSARFSGDS